MLEPASQNVLCTIDHNQAFLISGRSVDTIGTELTNLFSKLFMFVSISLTNASDGIRRAFCTSTRKGLPEPNIQSWKNKFHNSGFHHLCQNCSKESRSLVRQYPLFQQHETYNCHLDTQVGCCYLLSPRELAHYTVCFLPNAS